MLKEISYMEILLHSARFYYDPHFPKYSAFGIILSAVPTTPFTPARSLPIFPHPLHKQERWTVCPCDWKADTFDFVGLVWRDVRNRKGRSCLLQPQLHIYCASCVTQRRPFLPTSQAKVHGQQEWFYGALAYSGVWAPSTLIAVCTPLCPQHFLM